MITAEQSETFLLWVKREKESLYCERGANDFYAGQVSGMEDAYAEVIKKFEALLAESK